MEGKDIRLDKSAEMRAQFATVENYMVSNNFILSIYIYKEELFLLLHNFIWIKFSISVQQYLE